MSCKGLRELRKQRDYAERDAKPLLKTRLLAIAKVERKRAGRYRNRIPCSEGTIPYCDVVARLSGGQRGRKKTRSMVAPNHEGQQGRVAGNPCGWCGCGHSLMDGRPLWKNDGKRTPAGEEPSPPGARGLDGKKAPAAGMCETGARTFSLAGVRCVFPMADLAITKTSADARW